RDQELHPRAGRDRPARGAGPGRVDRRSDRQPCPDADPERRRHQGDDRRPHRGAEAAGHAPGGDGVEAGPARLPLLSAAGEAEPGGGGGGGAARAAPFHVRSPESVLGATDPAASIDESEWKYRPNDGSVAGLGCDCAVKLFTPPAIDPCYGNYLRVTA